MLVGVRYRAVSICPLLLSSALTEATAGTWAASGRRAKSAALSSLATSDTIGALPPRAIRTLADSFGTQAKKFTLLLGR